MKTHKKRNAVVAAVAGAALLLGGSTYALWSQSASFVGAPPIQAGDLQLTMDQSDIGFWDISPDRNPIQDETIQGGGWDLGIKGRPIDLTSTDTSGNLYFHPVPGDELMLTVPFSMKMQGANLLAQLEANTTTPTDTVSLESALKTTFDVRGGFDFSSFDNQALPGVDGFQSYVYTGDYGLNVGQTPGPLTGIYLQNGEGQFVLVIHVTFMDVQDRDFTQAVLTLADSVNLSLTQVRGDGWTPVPTP